MLKTKKTAFYRITELKELMADDTVSIADKNTIIAFTSAMIMSFISIILLIIAHQAPASYILHIVFFIVVVLGLFNINKILLKEVNGRITKYGSTVALILLCCYIFIKTDGLDGPGVIWFMFCYMFIGLVFDGGLATTYRLSTLVAFFISIYVSAAYDYGLNIEDPFRSMNNVFSFILVSVTLGIILQLEKNISNSERNRILAMSKKMAELNEELLNTQNELTDSNKMLEESLETVKDNLDMHRRFSTILTHELRSPLNGIIGTLKMMDDSELCEDNKENVEQCLSSSNYMLHIVNDLLDFAKLQVGKFEILPTDFDLHGVIGEINNLYKNMARSKGLNFEVLVDDSMVCGLYGDEYRIQQVANNLVSNAVKYTSEGNVTVSFDIKDECLEIKVKDEGQGISEESLEDLFTPFKRLNRKANAKIQGTGLGLSIVNELIKNMDGSLSVESEQGVGSEFKASIPVKISDSANIYKAHITRVQSTKEESKKTLNLSDKKMIYIDDSKINLKIFAHLLSKFNGQVETYENGEEGLDKLKTVKYDLAFVDYMIPGLSGLDILHSVKNEDTVNKETPMIVFTGDSGKGVEDKFLSMGFSGYLSKPISEEDMERVIKSVI